MTWEAAIFSGKRSFFSEIAFSSRVTGQDVVEVIRIQIAGREACDAEGPGTWWDLKTDKQEGKSDGVKKVRKVASAEHQDAEEE